MRGACLARGLLQQGCCVQGPAVLAVTAAGAASGRNVARLLAERTAVPHGRAACKGPTRC
jgi:hypothetical protein